MGEGTGSFSMMEFLQMGGYGGYVWSSYGIVVIVLFLNMYFSRRRHQALLRRLKRLHNSTDNNES